MHSPKYLGMSVTLDCSGELFCSLRHIMDQVALSDKWHKSGFWNPHLVISGAVGILFTKLLCLNSLRVKVWVCVQVSVEGRGVGSPGAEGTVVYRWL